MIRGSTARPMTAPARTTSINSPVAVRGALPFQNLLTMACSFCCDVITVNMTIPARVDSVNITAYHRNGMAVPASKRPKKKRPGRYHHGDLRRALLEEALRTIQADGVEHLTLRAVGEQ